MKMNNEQIQIECEGINKFLVYLVDDIIEFVIPIN